MEREPSRSSSRLRTLLGARTPREPEPSILLSGALESGAASLNLGHGLCLALGHETGLDFALDVVAAGGQGASGHGEAGAGWVVVDFVVGVAAGGEGERRGAGGEGREALFFVEVAGWEGGEAGACACRVGGRGAVALGEGLEPAKGKGDGGLDEEEGREEGGEFGHHDDGRL